MKEQNETSSLRYDVYIDSIKDEDAKKQIVMFLASVLKHMQLEDIISGISSLPFKIVNAVTEQTAMKLQERLGVRGAVVRMVQLIPGTVISTPEQNLSAPVIQTGSSQTFSASAQNFNGNQISLPRDTPTLPQEMPSKVSYIKRLWLNWVEVIFNAAAFFKSIDVEKQIPFPVIFALVWGTIAILLNMPNVIHTQQEYMKLFTGSMAGSGALPASTYVSVLIAAPFFLFIFLFVMAGVYHISVLLVGGKGGFVSTLKVLAYSIAAMVFEVIPYIGVPLFWFYSLYLYTMGFRELHKISTTRAFIAAILPVILLLLFIIIMVALFIVGFGVDFLRQFKSQIPGIPI